ncbi:transmembrane protein 273 isoform X2 [Tupaia chinensis]|uniref:transmembrane protein 273 isoform X2 n=1 Tax=Tupaia chinensis TaxID=246437 RepID=UPI000FFC3F16|nr:transmembrane protein 273 isoform X2 [Tupaia chinensis]
MGSGGSRLGALLFLLDFKYALIGTALGVAISAGFLALKICLIRKQLFDNDSSDLKSTPVGHHETIMLKKRDQRDVRVIEL